MFGIGLKEEIETIKKDIKAIDRQIYNIQLQQGEDHTQINYLLNKEIQTQRKQCSSMFLNADIPKNEILWSEQDKRISELISEKLKLESERDHYKKLSEELAIVSKRGYGFISEVKDSKFELSHYKFVYENLQSQNNQLQFENNDLKEDVKAYKNTLSKSDKQIKNLECERDHFKNLYSQFTNGELVSHTRAGIEAFKSEIQEWKSKYECEYDCNQKLAIENHNLKKNGFTTKTICSIMTELGIKFPVVNTTHMSDEAFFEIRKGELKNAFRNLQSEIYNLKSSNETYIEQIRLLNIKLTSLQNQDSEHEIKCLKRLNANLQTENSNLKTKNQNLECENQNQKVELQKWKTENQNYQKANIGLIDACCTYHKQCDALYEQVKGLEQKIRCNQYGEWRHDYKP